MWVRRGFGVFLAAFEQAAAARAFAQLKLLDRALNAARFFAGEGGGIVPRQGRRHSGSGAEVLAPDSGFHCGWVVGSIHRTPPEKYFTTQSTLPLALFLGQPPLTFLPYATFRASLSHQTRPR